MGAIGAHFTNRASFTVPSSFTFDTAVPFDWTIFNKGLTHSESVNPDQITIKTAGKYYVCIFSQPAVSSYTGGVGLILFINGVQSIYSSQWNNEGSSANNYQPCYGGQFIPEFNKGDIIQMKIAQRTGSTMTFGIAGTDIYLGFIGV